MYQKSTKQYVKVFRPHVSCPYICLVKWTLIGLLVVSPGKQKQPNCFTLVYELWPKCSAEFVTLTKRESRQKANEDPHAGWYWSLTVKWFW